MIKHLKENSNYYRSVNESKILKQLNDEGGLFEQTFKQNIKQFVFVQYLASIPVQLTKANEMIPELQQVVREGMEFINNYYLDFDSKKDAFGSVINLTMLNYDNFLETNLQANARKCFNFLRNKGRVYEQQKNSNLMNDEKIKLLTKQLAKEQVNSPAYQGALDGNLKELAVELLFIQ